MQEGGQRAILQCAGPGRPKLLLSARRACSRSARLLPAARARQASPRHLLCAGQGGRPGKPTGTPSHAHLPLLHTNTHGQLGTGHQTNLTAHPQFVYEGNKSVPETQKKKRTQCMNAALNTAWQRSTGFGVRPTWLGSLR